MHYIYYSWHFTNTFIFKTIIAHKIFSLSSKRVLIYSKQCMHIKQSLRNVRSYENYHSLSLFIITPSSINVFIFDCTISTVVYNRPTWKQTQSHWISIKVVSVQILFTIPMLLLTWEHRFFILIAENGWFSQVLGGLVYQAVSNSIVYLFQNNQHNSFSV